MKTRTGLAAGSILLASLFSLSNIAMADPAPLAQCGDIAQPGAYVLTQNLTATGNCLVIKSDDVTIDLNGFRILFQGTKTNTTDSAITE